MIRSPSLITLAVAAAVVAACDDPATPKVVLGVRVTPDTWTFTAIGDTTRFTALGKSAIGWDIRGPVTWSTVPPGIVFVREDGTAFAVRPGAAQVRATIGGVTGTAEVSGVQTIEYVLIFTALFGRLSALGDSILLPVDAFDRNSNPVAGTTFSFQSLNQNIATVSPTGWVKAVSPGTGDSGSSVRRWLLVAGVGTIIVAVVMLLFVLFRPIHGTADDEDEDEPDPD